MKLALILLAANAYAQTLATTGQTMVRFQSIAHNGSYTVVATDMGQQLTANTTVAWAIPQAGTTGFEADKYVYLNNVGTGVITLTPVTSTITGCGVTAASAITVAAYSSMRILSSGGNYVADMCGGGGGGVSFPNRILAKTYSGYTFLNGDAGTLVTFNAAAGVGVPQAGTTGFEIGKNFWVSNISASGTLSVVTFTSNFYGAGTSGMSFTLAAGQAAQLTSDGTNYNVLPYSLGGAGGTYTVDGITLTTCGTNEFCANTAVMSTRTNAAQAVDTYCTVTSATSNAFVGAMLGNAYTSGYQDGMRVLVNLSTFGYTSGTPTLDCGSGAKNIYEYNGTTPATSSDLATGQQVLVTYGGALNSSSGGWRLLSGGGSSPGPGTLLGQSQVATSETTNSPTAVNLTTPDAVTITLGASGHLIVQYSAVVSGSVTSGVCEDSIYVDGTLDGSSTGWAQVAQTSGTTGQVGMDSWVYRTSTSYSSGSHTIQVRHFVSAGNTGSWLNRQVLVSLGL